MKWSVFFLLALVLVLCACGTEVEVPEESIPEAQPATVFVATVVGKYTPTECGQSVLVAHGDTFSIANFGWFRLEVWFESPENGLPRPDLELRQWSASKPAWIEDFSVYPVEGTFDLVPQPGGTSATRWATITPKGEDEFLIEVIDGNVCARN